MSGGSSGGGYEDDAPGAERRKWKEFDCPDCSANNPTDDGFYEGAEVQCFYCGETYQVVLGDGGKPKFKSVG